MLSKSDKLRFFDELDLLATRLLASKVWNPFEKEEDYTRLQKYLLALIAIIKGWEDVAEEIDRFISIEVIKEIVENEGEERAKEILDKLKNTSPRNPKEEKKMMKEALKYSDKITQRYRNMIDESMKKKSNIQNKVEKILRKRKRTWDN